MSLPQSGARRAESHSRLLTSRRLIVGCLRRHIPALHFLFSPLLPALNPDDVIHPVHFLSTSWLQLTCLVCPQCITDDLRARGINVSTALPDDVLYFVRRHPLMSQHIRPIDRRPLLFRRTTDYTHMAVQAIQGIDGETYHVMYMGTGAY